jgi:hypothetical protein
MYLTEDQFNIQIGEACIAMRASDTFTLGRLSSLYSDFVCDNNPDITVELDIIETVSLDEIKQRVCNSNFCHKDGTFSFSDRLVSGQYDLSSKVVQISIEKQLLVHNYESYYLNQLMCLLYNSRFHINSVDRLKAQIVHSSAIVKNGYGLLFTGPSGIGKTTVAMMCNDHENTLVINDEGNLISRPDATSSPVSVHGIPIIGKLPQKSNISAPLSCILLLKQSNRTILRPLDRTEAFKRLMFQVVANVYFGQNDMNAILTSKADFCEEITGRIPCYELEFTLDKDLLHDTLDSLQQSLINGSKEPCLAK